MYPKNRIPMYEGDGFIHSGPTPGAAEDSCVPVPNQDDSGLEVERRPGAARAWLHKFAVWVAASLRHPQGKALEN
jgi:hypothetical protein